jgi:hypothetical protein
MDDAASIAVYYQLDPAQPAPLTIGGLRAYAVQDRRESARRLVAIQCRPDLPPRSRALLRLGNAPVPFTITPLDQGVGRDPAGREAWFIICAAPPGPAIALSPMVAWSEPETMRFLLQPVAAALNALAERGVTHRAIRPDNLFRAGPAEPVWLGPFWAAPPASLQPPCFEPPYSAMCLPSGRGEGTAADDVYALGAVMLWCILGGPAAWADPAGLLRRKLEHGSLVTLVGGAPLSQALQELLRLMLAEDPDHRPTPALLMVPDQARSRRLATRPVPRAQRPLEVGALSCATARELAHALATQPEQGVALIRNGAVDRWLRRILGDGQLAVLLEEMVEASAAADADEKRQQAGMLMRVAWVLDPLSPLIWRGIALFPDGLGPALVAAQAADQAVTSAALEELVTFDIIGFWCALQTKRKDLAGLRQESRDWRGWLTARGAMGGVKRLTYALNPLLACGSALLAGRVVVRLADLMPVLEALSARSEHKRPPIDAHIAAFVAARADSTLLADMGHLDGFVSPDERLSVLRLYARLQARLHATAFPNLAGWLLESGLIDLGQWRNLQTRKALGIRLGEAAAAGQIGAMLQIAQDDGARVADRTGAERAAARAAAITQHLAFITDSAAQRRTDAERLGHDIAAGAGMLAMLAAAIVIGVSA